MRPLARLAAVSLALLAPAAAAAAGAATELPDWPYAGLTLYTLPVAVKLPLPLGGPAGLAGEGGITIPALVPASVSGATFTFQAFVWDATSIHGLTHTNGLEIRFD